MSNPPNSTQYEVRGPVAIVTLDNPPVNGLGHALRTGIVAGLDKALADDKVKAIVLIGSNRAFSGGADVKEFGTPKAGMDPNLGVVIRALEDSTKPVIAAIGGMALGGGLELAMGAHFRAAKPDAQLGLPEVKLGLLPGAGGTQRLPRAVGKAKAMDLCLTARMMDAQEAERAGLVSRVVPLERLAEEAFAAAQKIAGYSAPVAMMIKESINRAYESSLSEGVRVERRVFHSQFALEDQKEGMAAFVEKRKPNFKNK
jgi:enoyl-CoA hydratase